MKNNHELEISRFDRLLCVEDLHTYFYTEEGVVHAVNGVDLSIKSGETLAIVGESGCGKSVTALSIIRLIAQPPGKICGGKIYFKNQNLLQMTNDEIRTIRGKDISMIFQEPMTSLNPVLTIGRQLCEGIQLHEGLSHREARNKAIEMLRRVGIPSAEKRIKDFPHQLSGGMRQRVMIAMALSCNPDILIADEPTTALDVTIQAQILRLISDLKDEFGMAVILITHDLGIVAQTANRIIVMYMGKVVETAMVKQLFNNPLHPYTQGLLKSLPNYYKDSVRKERLKEIPGVVGDLINIEDKCYFSPRCRYSQKLCHEKLPVLKEAESGHEVRCWQAEGGKLV